MINKNVLLIIMDGYGLNNNFYGNAIRHASTPNLDELFEKFPNTTLNASGLSVGLPHGQMGNSEVGHTNMGAGRTVYQELTRISKSIEDGDFYNNKALVDCMQSAKNNNNSLHLMGLLSDGGVHSHSTHLYALLRLAKMLDVKDVYIHCFMDGRDVSPTSGIEFIKELEQQISKIGVGKIATICGRYYSMDRDKRYDRVKKAYNAMVLCEGEYTDSPVEYMKISYDNNITDEFIIPCVLDNTNPIKKNDSVIFFNFRPDRAREITRALCDPDFDGFERKNGYFPLNFVCMTTYDAKMPNVEVAFSPQSLENTLGEYISKNNLTQLRIAETEKYAHVTFFFNGGIETPYDGEDRILIPSPKVATYDLMPEMSAYLVTDEVIKQISQKKYNLIVLNFANCDMVGHTGVFDAAIKAVQVVDECVGKTVPSAINSGYTCLITSDHGNSDCMLDESNQPFTAHTTNLVPLILTDKSVSLKSGGLCDIAPTLIAIMGLDIPKQMTGKNLIIKEKIL